MDSSFQEQDSSWAPKQDMSLLCRVCANQQDYLIPIFEGEGLDHDMPTKMQKYLPVKVRETDKLPIQMCYQCASTIIAWSDLVTNCLEADKKLKGMLKINEKNAERKETESTLDDDTYDDSTHFDDTGDVGGGDDASDEDFEKEIKQLISDAGVELPSTSKNTRSTRKRKAEIVSKKSDTKRSKSDTSKAGLLKPKEEVQSGGEDRWAWACCHCNDIFSNAPELIKHNVLDHPDVNSDSINNKVCSACHLSFLRHAQDITKLSSTNRIKVEIVEVGEEEEYDEAYGVVEEQHIGVTTSKCFDLNIFVCFYCNIYFTKKSILRTHIKRSHNTLYNVIETYECTLCEKSYIRRQDITKHLSNTHAVVETDDITSVIRQSARKVDIAEVHESLNERTHESIEIYECKPCAKKYTRKQDIVKHLRNVHNQIKVEPSLYVLDHDDPRKLDALNYNKKMRYTFKCKPCNKLYTRQQDILKHLRTVHDEHGDVNVDHYCVYKETLYGCNYCEDAFLSLDNLRSHCEKEHCQFISHIYLCPYCSIYFLDGQTMMEHLSLSHGIGDENTLKKTIVPQGKQRVSARGVNKNKNNTSSYICNHCIAPSTFTSNTKTAMENHLKMCHEAPIYDYTLSVTTKLCRKSISVKKDVLECNECKQTFASKSRLTSHVQEEHFLFNNSTLLCQFCGELFENLNAVWSHVFSKHKARDLQCSFCSTVFNRRNELIKHMGAKHDIVLRINTDSGLTELKTKSSVYIDGMLRYQCQECSAVLHSFTTLRSHILTHTGEKPIVCDRCSKQFRTSSQLKVHIVSVHENIRRYGCEYCGHAFACSSNLAQHLRIHTGEKPYVCDECGSSYAQHASLYSHKLTHSQNRCHVCEECGRAFHRLTRLNQHMRIHTGNRPAKTHICEICQKGFRTKSEMKRHQLIHNQERSFVCETCGSGFTLKKYLVQHYKVHRHHENELVSAETELNPIVIETFSLRKH